MKTRITDLLNIKYPIVLSGMSWISTPELVAAVSNAGGLGILATGVLAPAETRKAINQVRQLTKKPFAANVTLYFPGSEMNAAVLIEEKVPIVNYSLGKGRSIAEAVHSYGGKVIATVTTLRHAIAAQNEGADALIVTGHEAAGHGGDVTSLVLIPTIADAVEIPVIAAGGFADGRGLVAALSLGADGISMGTRFMNTVESPVHESQKSVSIQKNAFDTLYTDRIDGMPARMLNAKGSQRLMKKHLNPFRALIKSFGITRDLGLPWSRLIKDMLFSSSQKKSSGTKTENPKDNTGSRSKKSGKGLFGSLKSMKRTLIQLSRMATGFDAFKKGTMDGDNIRGVLPLGQITGIIHDTPTVSEAIERIITESEEAQSRVSKNFKY